MLESELGMFCGNKNAFPKRGCSGNRMEKATNRNKGMGIGFDATLKRVVSGGRCQIPQGDSVRRMAVSNIK